jgi:hypothetical protein
MHWLVIGLIVSLTGLLAAAAAMARHIWLQHHRPRVSEPSNNLAARADETDLESEP